MTIEKLQACYNAQPFQPFVLHLADGRNVPVVHRDFIAASPTGRTVVVIQPDDSMNIIDLLLVTDIELKRSKNGAGKHRKN